MNFSVCGIGNNNELIKNKANIVFSTFINFESLYLRIMEIYPSYIHKYFNDCSLLIDEADSILIDELTNGTILSRPMNTNGKEILTFVYKCHKNKIDVNQVFNEVKNLWPECADLSINDIKEMYKEIDIVNQPEFTNGKKYSIETIYVKEKSKTLKQNFKDVLKAIKMKSFEEIHKIFKNDDGKTNGISENDVIDDLNAYEDSEDSESSDDSFDEAEIERKDKKKSAKNKIKNFQ